MGNQFKALIVSQDADGNFVQAVGARDTDALPDGDVLVRVKYSSMNYKDALSCVGNKGVTRNYPHTPGIDAAGVVEESTVDEFKPGDEVVVTSYDLGMNTSGGLAEYIRVPAGWVVPLPAGLTLKESMMFGTAGFTAGMCLMKLEEAGLTPAAGPVVVTGATGGVGCAAVAILARAGYAAHAVTGKADRAEFLRAIGATEVLGRDALDSDNPRPMLKARWAAAIDTVGGAPLAAVLKCINYGGAVAACGLAASPELNTTVFPFILRSVSLFGIDSAECAMPRRRAIWNKLAADWKPAALEQLHTEHALEDVPDLVLKMLAGQHAGRAVIAL